jgi:hypothetical protein
MFLPSLLFFILGLLIRQVNHDQLKPHGLMRRVTAPGWMRPMDLSLPVPLPHPVSPYFPQNRVRFSSSFMPLFGFNFQIRYVWRAALLFVRVRCSHGHIGTDIVRKRAESGFYQEWRISSPEI